MQAKLRQRSVASMGAAVAAPDATALVNACGCPGRRRDGTAPALVSAVPAQGFTLVELLVTIAVIAIITVIAVPSFKNLTLSNRLSTTADGMVAAINTARMESIKRNASVLFCSDSASANGSDALGTSCGSQAGAVYAASGQIRAPVTGIDAPIKLNGSVVALRFSPQGLGYKVGETIPYSGTVVDLCTASLPSGKHRLIKMVTGSVITTTTTDEDCP